MAYSFRSPCRRTPRSGSSGYPSQLQHILKPLHMTPTLKEAIVRLRELPEDDQDAAAAAIFAYISSDDRDERFSSDGGMRTPLGQ